ncbi:EAL domain-containing protein [Nostoc punctiforme]|uniref:Diguanylate cyclase/phosphodiesterase with PAS/PAC and GAF sensor(S) n=1 Tax=Nostoc punctiforme (strain ATCC 29133 / PCC 73102) TaxID=63737 RepID=B2J5P2_NOSP7|nr:EAL domain-containing protein [Nostoc punctiforme]ACC83774.1 diguanylate cyclase/phosphodiesterase with PAS/PAC and GAF sensor(s) [Nostoc punctiforme PCC 73102]
MLEFWKSLFAYKQFIPHGHCYLWKPELVGLHIVSDSLIALAYYSIPIALVYFVRKRQDFPFNWIFLLFATFIITCGTTHLMDIWTLWYPTYWLSGCIKAITAIISLYTASELIPLIPKALALPSHAQLEIANQELEREISIRKQAELALQEREAMLRRISDNLPNGAIYKVIRELDGSDRFDYISAGIERLMEVRVEDVLKDSSLLYRQFIPEDVPLLQAAVDESRRNFSVFDIQLRIQTPSARLKWLHFRSTPRQLQDGRVVWDGLVVDVTDLKRVEETLRKSEALLEESQQVARLGNWEFELATGKITWSKQLFDLFNRDPELLEPNYQENLQLYCPEDAGKLAQATERAMSTGESYQLILRASPIYGSTIYIEGIGHAEFNADGKVIRLYGTAQDVTERQAALNKRKQAEEELRRSETLLATAQKIAHLGSWEWHLGSEKQIWSAETFRIFGLNPAESVPTQATFLQMLYPEDRPVLQRHLLQAIANGNPFNLEYRIVQPDGSLRYLESRAEVAYDTQGKTVRLYGAILDITERKQAEIALKQSEIRYRAIVEDQTEFIARYLPDGTITFVNQAFTRYFGRSPEQLIDSCYQPIIFEADRERVAQLIAAMNADNPVAIIENRVILEDSVRWTQWHNRMLFDEQGCFIEFQTVGRDITALKQIEETLFQEKELAQVTLQSIRDAVITTDAFGRIQYLNPVAESLIGCSEASAKGVLLEEVFRIVHETTREKVKNPIEQALQENRIVSLANHTVLITGRDQEIAIQDSAAPIRNREGQVIGAVMVFHDVTQNRLLSRQLSWQATHDALTGLVNRQEFERRVEQALHVAKLDYQVYTLCYLDLDHFKIVNDTCGHVAGDELLRQITVLLQEKVRKTDTLARFGGDEFGLLLTQCTLEEALRVANNLLSCVQEFRFVWQEQVFSIGVSIGLVVIDTNSESLAEIISTADAACYTAKNRGRNRVYVAQTDDQERLQQRGQMQWVGRISQALESDWFCLYVQRIAAIIPTDQNGDHYEVLLRLRDEQGKLVLPMAFIPAAERYNLMHLIDRWVIRTLFKNWSRVVDNKQSIYAINLSGSSINDDRFIDFLHEQFTLHPISPQHICFEITETVAIANLLKARQFIQKLQRMGCRFALDDFGAGMSSFAYLKSLPIDYLKIDGSFIRNIVENPVDNAIVTAITRISSVMGIQTIAEFVENDAILERITALGIDYAQGYGIAVPHPLGKI